MVIYLEQKKIHFDLRFILSYNVYKGLNANFRTPELQPKPSYAEKRSIQMNSP